MKKSQVVLISFLISLLSSQNAFSKETLNSASSDLIFHNTEIASEIQVETRASETVIKKDLEQAVREMFMYVEIENLMAYTRTGGHSEELGSLNSRLIVFQNEKRNKEPYQVDWKLIFQFWNGNEVTLRRSFKCSKKDANKIFKRKEFKKLMNEFISSAVKKFQATIDSQDPEMQAQFEDYLKTLEPKILDQNKTFLVKMTGSYPEELKKFRQKLEGQDQTPKKKAGEEVKVKSPEIKPIQKPKVVKKSTEALPKSQKAEAQKKKEPTPKAAGAVLETVKPKKAEKPKASKPAKVKAPKKEKSIVVASATAFHPLLAEYFQLEGERKKALKDYDRYSALSKKMGKIKSKLQTLGFYDLSAGERNGLQKDVQKQLGLSAAV